jgi:hypothetical protein
MQEKVDRWSFDEIKNALFNSKKEVFIFTHIPKTSGSSINLILRKQKGDCFWHHCEGDSKVPMYISSHSSYGAHNIWNLNEKNVKYFTILRDPIERWKSAFNQILFYRKSAGAKKFYGSCEKDIRKFLKLCIDENRNKNTMTKMISGVMGNSYFKSQSGKIFFTQTAQFTNNPMPDIEESRMIEILKTAKNNLLNKYYFVGFMEDEDNQKKMCNALRLKYDNEIFKNRIKKIEDFKEIDWEGKDVKEMLIKLNKYDIRLYDFAINKIFHRVIET